MQYGNAFGQGMQAAALKPADFFGNDDVLYLMEDMATGEIRLSILWEWLHKGARSPTDDAATGVKAGDVFTRRAASRGCSPRSTRKLQHGRATATCTTTRRRRRCRSRARSSRRYVRDDVKLPWYIDLLNITLGNHDLATRRRASSSWRRVCGGRDANYGESRLLGDVGMWD